MADANRLDTVEIDGLRLRERRKLLRLTQAEVADRSGAISRGYVSVIETKGTVRVSRKAAEALAQSLGTSVTKLVPSRGSSGAIRFSSGTSLTGKRAQRLRRVVLQLRAVANELDEFIKSEAKDSH